MSYTYDRRKRSQWPENTASVGLSMMCDRKGKRKEDVFGRCPVEGTHGEVIVLSVPDSKLLLEVLKGIKTM